jgi:hypothetical protein
VGDFQEMRNVEISGATELVAMTLRGNLIRTAYHPGIFGRTIFAEFFEELLEAQFNLANGAVALEAQRNIAGRRHILVYAGKGQCASCGRAGGLYNPKMGKGSFAGVPVENRFTTADSADALRMIVASAPNASA